MKALRASKYKELDASGLKYCSACKKVLQKDLFNIDRWSVTGRSSKCRNCKKQHRTSKLDSIRAYYREYNRRNKSKKAAYQKKYIGKPEIKAAYEIKNKKNRVIAFVKRRKLRYELIAAYGGKCQCCGESSQEFLTIDHIDGTGHVKRSDKIGPQLGQYLWLKKQNWPTDNYQLLCHNCNFVKGKDKACPHESMRLLYGGVQ